MKAPVNPVVLYGSVEPFRVGVHQRGFGIGVVVGQVKFPEFLREMLFEFRTIVRQRVQEIE